MDRASDRRLRCRSLPLHLLCKDCLPDVPDFVMTWLARALAGSALSYYLFPNLSVWLPV